MNEFFDLFLQQKAPAENTCRHSWVETEEFLVCELCGDCKSFFAPATPPLLEYKKAYNIYNRNTHFKTWINQIQGKDNYVIPADLWTVLQTIPEPSTTEIRKILKQHKASKLYKATPYILAKLNNREPPRFSYNDIELLENYFQQIVRSYEKFKNPKAKNMIRYAYILYKLCQMLGFHDFLQYLTLPKIRTKIMENEIIWMKICEKHGWTFLPLV